MLKIGLDHVFLKPRLNLIFRRKKTVYFSGIEEDYLLVGGDCKTGSPPVNKNMITESQHQRKAHLLQLFKLKIKQSNYTLLRQLHAHGMIVYQIQFLVFNFVLAESATGFTFFSIFCKKFGMPIALHFRPMLSNLDADCFHCQL